MKHNLDIVNGLRKGEDFQGKNIKNILSFFFYYANKEKFEMLDKNNDEARQFLFTYFKPSDKNSIEQYEDDFIAQFQLIHNEIEQANEKLCETYEDILLAYDQATPHKCVDCKKKIAYFAFEECGHVLFCEDCIQKIQDEEESKFVKIACPVCKICYNTNTYILDGTKKPVFNNLRELFGQQPETQKKADTNSLNDTT